MLGKAIKYDLKEGIFNRLKYFIVFAIIFTFIVIKTIFELKANIENPSFTDILIYIFKGAGSYQEELGKSFQIPAVYSVLFLYLSFFTSYYTRKELYLRGKTYIYKYENKRNWWYSKVYFNVIGVLILYTIMAVITLISSLICKSGQLGLNDSIIYSLSGELTTFNSVKILMYIFILGPLAIIALNQIQMILQLIFPPAVGVVFIIVQMTASVYYTSFFWLGNSFMLYKTKLFSTGSVGFYQAFIFLLSLCIISTIVGKKIIQKKDII